MGDLGKQGAGDGSGDGACGGGGGGESMFRLDGPNVLSIKVGWGETHAKYRVRDPGEMRRVLMEALFA